MAAYNEVKLDATGISETGILYKTDVVTPLEQAALGGDALSQQALDRIAANESDIATAQSNIATLDAGAYVPYDSGWIDATDDVSDDFTVEAIGFTDGFVRYRRIIDTVSVQIFGVLQNAEGTFTMFTLPEGFRPTLDQQHFIRLDVAIGPIYTMARVTVQPCNGTSNPGAVRPVAAGTAFHTSCEFSFITDEDTPA